MPWATVFGNVFLPLKLAGIAKSRGGAAHHGGAGARRPCRFRAMPIRASCPAACGCAFRSRARSSPRRACLLMDEPFAALDEITRFKLNDDLVALCRELRMTVVFVTHSVFESVFLSSRIVVMTGRPGRVSSELAIDALVRDANFRTSAEYAGYCRVASKALAKAMRAHAGAAA